MACPYFVPTEPDPDGGWLHPRRLPLGAGYKGHCCSPISTDAPPSDEAVRESCNIGYAKHCPRLPQDRNADALRFCISRDRDGSIAVRWVAELNYLPGEHGTVIYNELRREWESTATDNVQRLAECFVKTYLASRCERVQIEASKAAAAF